eukprot:9490391-Pyramimonas_sp.AAC.1
MLRIVRCGRKDYPKVTKGAYLATDGGCGADRWQSCGRKDYPKVAELRGTFPVQYPSSRLADKAFSLFQRLREDQGTDATFGCLDPVQPPPPRPTGCVTGCGGVHRVTEGHTTDYPGGGYSARVAGIRRHTSKWIACLLSLTMPYDDIPHDCPTVRLSDCPTVRLSDFPTVRLSDCPTVRLSDCPTGGRRYALYVGVFASWRTQQAPKIIFTVWQRSPGSGRCGVMTPHNPIVLLERTLEDPRGP